MSNQEKDKLAGVMASATAPAGGATATVVARALPDEPQALDEPGIAFWAALRNRVDAISYPRYRDFIDRVFCAGSAPLIKNLAESCMRVCIPIDRGGCGPADMNPDQKLVVARLSHGMHAYEALQTATEIFLLLECGLFVEDYPGGTPPLPGPDGRVVGAGGQPVDKGALTKLLEQNLPGGRLRYIDMIMSAGFPGDTVLLPFCEPQALRARASCPCLLELIWSYWHEEGMLAQSMNAISMRFQNRRSVEGRDPLAHLTVDPLRPLSNLMWGYVQDEQHRLSLARRAYEYDHEYGLTLVGKAVPKLRSVDSRSKFIETFHDLLYRCSVFYREERNLQYVPDAFVLLNAAKDVHQLLAQGAHNQFGDLPSTARQEMLMQMWLLARPQLREFLGRRPMMPYQEDWMANIDALKTLQGWTDVSITHFHNLANYGEQILLSLRWFDWMNQNDPAVARAWAKFFRPEILGYIHAYRVVTGVDLTLDPKDDGGTSDRATKPSELLRRRLEQQRSTQAGA